MNRYKNHLIAAGVLSVLAIIGTIMNSHQSVLQAAGGPTVTIDPDQLPLPVHVNNTVTDPVRVRNVNDAVQPFQGTGVCTVPARSATVCFQNLFFVPTGKRAVIEYFSGNANNISVGQVNFAITTTLGGFEVHHFLPVTPTQIAFPSWGQQLRLYADSGSVIKGSASIDLQSADILVGFSVSGYLVDVPFTP